MNTVEINGVSKAFDGAAALSNVSITIQEGDFFSLLGPSGCGKTTLLRMIAGFEFPDSGTVLIKGQDMSAVPPNKRPVNMVFQSYALFPHLSIFDNIAFGLQQSKVPKSEIAERVKSALELVRLPSIADRSPSQLSGGQQQRVAFARAIVNRPAVLLLDEPLSALDPKVRHEMQTELARFKRELNMTFIMVSHDQSEAFALSNRIAVMSRGKVEQIGSPEEIYENPASAFVADFIGNSNLVRGTVIEPNADSALVKTSDGSILKALNPKKISAGKEAIVWFRSSSLKLSSATCNSPNELETTVMHRSFQGESCDYHLKVSEGVFVNATVNSSHKPHFSPGDKCVVSFDVSAARVLEG